jgi:hypothetical protein
MKKQSLIEKALQNPSKIPCQAPESAIDKKIKDLQVAY